MSALPLIADIRQCRCDVRKVPKADIHRLQRAALITTSMVKARWISSVKKPVAELMGVTNNAATYDTHSVCGADGTRSTNDTRVTRRASRVCLRSVRPYSMEVDHAIHGD